ncbi:MAG: permease YjgP/YjgQ family protein [Panacagrimonas sp.]|nr:permease YjgP/YjgQ family protein [Panacagrimonas sp.]
MVGASVRWRPDRLDLYTLRLFAAPLLFALATLLLAQMLERLLRLFDLAASTGADLVALLRMAGNLVPHYLGMALPTAFTAAIFMAVARLGDNSELDVMLGTGRSIVRVAMPYFGVALLLSAFNLYLFGYLQPISRYGYHAAVHDALQAGWDARVEGNRFVNAGGGYLLSARTVERDGRTLGGVFVHRRVGQSEEITTARHGHLQPSPDGRRLLLELEDGVILRENADASVTRLRFDNGRINADFTPTPPAFRPRGDSVRELTVRELWRGLHGELPDSDIPRRKLAGEFHGRLARSVLLPLLVLLALPLGMASKRGRRAPGVVFACLALLTLNHALQFGESLAESGRASALIAVWLPVGTFALFSAWLFRGSLAWPGDNPVSRAIAFIETGFEGFGRQRKRK